MLQTGKNPKPGPTEWLHEMYSHHSLLQWVSNNGIRSFSEEAHCSTCSVGETPDATLGVKEMYSANLPQPFISIKSNTQLAYGVRTQVGSCPWEGTDGSWGHFVVYEEEGEVLLDLGAAYLSVYI